ncbi:hypothetical protein KIH74_25450 [Kineosporia sp. J2-2]|uniref:Uncharacterized protein n=1 Tax=Kineosporia corallincola TaxID=2835133 RepID=A0ABS5TQ58_9ACTN|nr:hypothetical protein [Kineosporia corallincola]MBT0772316.1 hypothetical protein [Kineosporia corallincola]
MTPEEAYVEGYRAALADVHARETGGFSVARTLGLARYILAGLPVEDPAVVRARRQALVDEEREMRLRGCGPVGRPVVGRGGVVRWVSAA